MNTPLHSIIAGVLGLALFFVVRKWSRRKGSSDAGWIGDTDSGHHDGGHHGSGDSGGGSDGGGSDGGGGSD